MCTVGKALNTTQHHPRRQGQQKINAHTKFLATKLGIDDTSPKSEIVNDGHAFSFKKIMQAKTHTKEKNNHYNVMFI